MKKHVFTLLVILVGAFFNVARSQSINEVLEKHFKAVGQDKIVNVESFYIKAKVSRMGMEMPMEMATPA